MDTAVGTIPYFFLSRTRTAYILTPPRLIHSYIFSFTARPHTSGDQAEGGGGRHPVMTRTRLSRIIGLSSHQRCDSTLPVVFHQSEGGAQNP